MRVRDQEYEKINQWCRPEGTAAAPQSGGAVVSSSFLKTACGAAGCRRLVVHFIKFSRSGSAWRVWLTPILCTRTTYCTPYCSATVLTGVKFFR